MFTGPDSEDSETSFRLDGNTGEIWAAQLRSGVYRLMVAARDGSGYEAAQVAQVRITVLAADPAKPYAVFVKSQYSFTVLEDAPVGTAVGNVEVSPNQSGMYNYPPRISKFWVVIGGWLVGGKLSVSLKRIYSRTRKYKEKSNLSCGNVVVHVVIAYSVYIVQVCSLKRQLLHAHTETKPHDTKVEYM